MNKKIIIFAFIILIIIAIVYLIVNNRLNETENNVVNHEIEQNTEIQDNYGNKYIVKYNEKNLVYEICDENGFLVAIASNESELATYIENPDLIFMSNGEDKIE